jgi:hypothetical protein
MKIGGLPKTISIISSLISTGFLFETENNKEYN